MTFCIRRAEVDDSPSLAEIELLTAPEFATFLLEGLCGDTSVGAILSWRYRQGGVDSTDWSWIAESDGQSVGAMGAYPVALSKAECGTDHGLAHERNAHFAPISPMMRDDAFHIARIGVMPNARRQGIASALVRTAADVARKHKLRLLTLVVWADNQPALNLYKGLGLEFLDSAQIAEHPRLAHSGEILMLGKSLV